MPYTTHNDDMKLDQLLAQYIRQEGTALLKVLNINHIRHYKLSWEHIDKQ